ncbi:ABC transporter permease [bacterium]|nr:ABC transporter permease [bacterium]
MRIRQQLEPGRQRLLMMASIATSLVLWFILSTPMLPPKAGDGQDLPHRYEATLDQGDVAANGNGNGEEKAEEVAPSKRPIVPAYILPSPVAVVKALGYLHTEQALVRSAFFSLKRITLGFLAAALVAIPLGIIMGTYPPLKTWIEPLSGPLRFLPITAITPLFVLWFGIDETMKIAFLFLGTVVYLLPIVVEQVEKVDEVYLETAYTLGASQWQAISRVLIPASAPGIWEACRVIYGIGWTYVILAELINARYGLGYLITLSAKRGHIDWIYALVFVILLLGIGTNKLFLLGARQLFGGREA